MCLAIMAWAVCWKKVLMKNPLNVLVEIYGILGNFAKVSNSLFDQTILQDVFFVVLWVNRVDNLGMDN